MTSAVQRNYKSELTMLRKFMRNQSVTQAMICTHFDWGQPRASLLIRELVNIGHVKKDGKVLGANGKLGVQVYSLTDKYLATLKPQTSTTPEPHQDAAVESTTSLPEQQEIAFVEAPVADVPVVEPVVEPIEPPAKRSRNWDEAVTVFSIFAGGALGVALAWISSKIPA